MSQRILCLDGRMRAFEGVTAVLRTADVQTIDSAQRAILGLPTLDGCSDMEHGGPTLDEATRREVLEIEGELGRAGALEAAGRWSEATQVTRSAVARARQIGEPRIEVAALFKLGRSLLEEDLDRGRELLYEVHRRAESLGDHSTATRALVQLIWGEATAGNYEEAERLARQAQAKLEHQAVHEMVEASLLNHWAIVRANQGDYDEAERMYRRALAIFEGLHGPDHLFSAGMLTNLASLFHRQRKLDDALAAAERALATQEKVLGPDHPHVPMSLSILASVLVERGDYDQAIAHLERALAIDEKVYGPKHHKVGSDLHALAEALAEKGQLDEAWSHQQRGLEILEAKLGADHPEVGEALFGMSDVASRRGQSEQALALAERSLTVLDKLDDGHPLQAPARTALGVALLGLGRPHDATEPLERAIAILGARTSDALGLAEPRFALARALWQAGREKQRARNLASQALDAYVEAGPGRSADRATVQAWLDGHPAPDP
jgi:tetratricopeptide (TPR) repeat protein